MPFDLKLWHVAIVGAIGLLLILKFKGFWPFGGTVQIKSNIPNEADIKLRSRKAGRVLLDVHNDVQTLTKLDAAANGGLGALEQNPTKTNS